MAGLAVSSGRSLFVYGPSGNGKSSLGRQIHAALRGDFWIPYCIAVREQRDPPVRRAGPPAGRGRRGQGGGHRPALGPDPPAAGRRRRRTDARVPRPGLQPVAAVLRGAAAPEGQRRRVPGGRLRPRAGVARPAAQPLHHPDGAPVRLLHPVHRAEDPGAAAARAHHRHQPEPGDGHGPGLPPPHGLPALPGGADPGAVRQDLHGLRRAARRRRRRRAARQAAGAVPRAGPGAAGVRAARPDRAGPRHLPLPTAGRWS